MQISKIKYFLPSVFIAAFIAYGSLTSGEDSSVLKIFNIGISDKLIHGLSYFLLSISIFYPILLLKYNIDAKMFLVLLMLFSYGVIMEMMQYFLINERSGELLDVIANTAGIVVAFGTVKVYKHKTQKT